MTTIFLSLCILIYLVLDLLWKPQARLPKGTRDAVRVIFAFIAILCLRPAVGSVTGDRKVGEFHSSSFHQGELQPILSFSDEAPAEIVIEYNRRSWWGLKNAGTSIAQKEGIGFRYQDGGTWHQVPREVVGQANAMGQTLW